MPASSALLLGPAGVGKSSTANLYAVSAAKRGERAVIFVFDETKSALMRRSAGLGMNLEKYVADGLIVIKQLDPGQLSPGEFAFIVRESIKPDDLNREVSVVVIDSLNGYLNAMPHERFLTKQMHELLKYLGSLGIVTFLVLKQATACLRTSSHERTIREFRMANNSIIVGKPLREFHGILGGTPRYRGEHSDLLKAENHG